MGPREEVESVGAAVMEAETPRRGRPPRQAAEQEVRRRRQPGSLNRMTSSPLSIPDECKDPDYHYHWVNDVRGRVQALTTHDDYDVVTVDELDEMAKRNRAGAFNREGFTGNGETVSLAVERDGTRAVLLKKRQSFYDADYIEGLDARQAMMEGRVVHGALDVENDTGARAVRAEMGGQWDSGETYVPKSVNVQLPPMRKRGPIPQRRL